MQRNNVEKNTQKIAREAVRETLISLGFSADEPHENQADLMYLRKMRKGSEEMGRWVRRCIIFVTIPSFLYLLWEVLRQALTK